MAVALKLVEVFPNIDHSFLQSVLGQRFALKDAYSTIEETLAVLLNDLKKRSLPLLLQ
jgi:hypothetical protein